MALHPDDQHKRYAQIVAKAWADETFMARLLQEPAQVLCEYGIPVPDGVEVRAVQNTNSVIHLVLPARPDAELSEEHLQKVSGVLCCYPGLFRW